MSIRLLGVRWRAGGAPAAPAPDFSAPFRRPLRPHSLGIARLLRPLARRTRLAALLAVAALMSGVVHRAWGQPASGASVADGATATRADLTAAADAADRRGDGAKARELRARLTRGDFEVGDRFEVTLTVDTAAPPRSLTVRDSQRVDVPPLGVVSLQGVLRSELQPTMERFYAQYYRNPTVRVQSYLRIGFLGAVNKPGFYSVPPDAPVADAFKDLAGGPAGNANLKKLEVKRDGRRILDHGAYERVAREGQTFDQVALRSGDEISVPPIKPTNRVQTIRLVATALGIFTTLLVLIRQANNNY